MYYFYLFKFTIYNSFKFYIFSEKIVKYDTGKCGIENQLQILFQSIENNNSNLSRLTEEIRNTGNQLLIMKRWEFTRNVEDSKLV